MGARTSSSSSSPAIYHGSSASCRSRTAPSTPRSSRRRSAPTPAERVAFLRSAQGGEGPGHEIELVVGDGADVEEEAIVGDAPDDGGIAGAQGGVEVLRPAP